MKLASFSVEGRDRYGIVDGQRLLDLSGVRESLAGAPAPATLQALIEAGAAGLAWARSASQSGGLTAFETSQVQWQAPVRQPSKICCVALNNSANRDRILSGPSHPATFIKPASALIGHGGAIECYADYGRVHPEPELAVVIGRRARRIRAEEAYDYVFGYTIHNDITSPTMRGEDTFHYRAIHPGEGEREIRHVDTWVSYPGRYKCADTFACMGPWVVTREEIPDPHALAVSCSHKGEVITRDSTRNLTHHTPQLLAFITHYMTLLPGDIVSLGTALQASGSGGAVQNIDLNRLGGPVSVAIEGIGELTNDVRRLD